jgi:hypothetical protein
MCRSGTVPRALRARVAAAQQAERTHLGRLRDGSGRAAVRIWSLAEAVARPDAVLRAVLCDLDVSPRTPGAKLPRARVPDGLAAFLRALRDDGLPLEAVGDPEAFAMLADLQGVQPAWAGP